MTTTASESLDGIEVSGDAARTTRNVVGVNADGLTHEHSVAQPTPGGNCLNWVVADLLCILVVSSAYAAGSVQCRDESP